MMLTPGGAVLVGAIAAVLSVCGFRFGHDGDGGDNGNYKNSHYTAHRAVVRSVSSY